MGEICQTMASRKMASLSTMRPLARGRVLQKGGQVYTPPLYSRAGGGPSFKIASTLAFRKTTPGRSSCLQEAEIGSVQTGAGMT